MENELTSKVNEKKVIKQKSSSRAPTTNRNIEDSKPHLRSRTSAKIHSSIKQDVKSPATTMEAGESKNSELKAESQANARGEDETPWTPSSSSSSSAAPTRDPTPTSSNAGGDTDQDRDDPTSYEIKWNNYALMLQNAFRKVLLSHQFSDVTLACKGGRIKCHRILLAACSPDFEDIFSDNQDKDLIIYMKDMNFWELKALVNFMYNGQVCVDEEQLLSFMKAAEALNIRSLVGENSGVGTATEDRTVAESTAQAKSVRTYNRPSSGRSDNSYLAAANRRPAMAAHGARFAPALEAQSMYGTTRVHSTMKRKAILNNVRYGPPPKLVRVQQTRSNGVTDLGMRTATWTDDCEMDNQPADNDHEPNGHVENGVYEDETGSELQQYEYDQDHEDDNYSYGDGHGMNVYGLEGNQENGEFGDDDEPSYDGEMDAEDGMMILNPTPPPGARNRRSYSPALQEEAFSYLRDGISIRQCSERLGIPRKTLGKWKNRGLHLQQSNRKNEAPHSPVNYNSPIPKKRGPAVGSRNFGPESAERLRRLQKATEMAMTGVTVRQAAAQFDIPRTTLCAYMKKQGLASQTRYMQSTKTQSLYQPQQRRVEGGGTSRTLRSSGSGTGSNNRPITYGSVGEQQDLDNGDEDEEEDEIPFFGLSDLLDQHSYNLEDAS